MNKASRIASVAKVGKVLCSAEVWAAVQADRLQAGNGSSAGPHTASAPQAEAGGADVNSASRATSASGCESVSAMVERVSATDLGLASLKGVPEPVSTGQQGAMGA